MFITPSEFEEQWARLIEDFKLQNHKWLTKLYDMRSTWIPAYFKEMDLCGLMRTTSRSESENSFFGNFLEKMTTLVNFMLCFETSMEKQRYTQEVLDKKSTDTTPKYTTRLKIERHAAQIYSREIFNLVQIEILKSLWACSIHQLKTDEGCQEYVIKEKREFTEKEKSASEEWEVELWPEEKTPITYDYKVH